MTRLALSLAAALAVGCPLAYADETKHACVPLAVLKSKDGFKGATFKDLTPGQTNFARGLYVMDTHTPEGMPRGDRAILAAKENERLILWLNGPLVCSIEPVAAAIDEMLTQIKTGKIVDGAEL